MASVVRESQWPLGPSKRFFKSHGINRLVQRWLMPVYWEDWPWLMQVLALFMVLQVPLEACFPTPLTVLSVRP